MVFDLLSMAELTAGAAVVIVALASVFGRSLAERTAVASALTAWLAAVLWAGASGVLNYQGGLGSPGLGATVALTVAALTLLGLGRGRGRARILKRRWPP